MIKYALACEHGHLFEGWFASSDDYDDQSARSLVDCPVCGSKSVKKQIMAPAVAGTKRRAMMKEAVGKMRRHVEENFDYVGDAFAKEARAIHDGTSEDRGIYGEASPKQVKALIEDGIKVAPLPAPPPADDELN
jgi:hypothetical protein